MDSKRTMGCLSFALYWAWVFSTIVGSGLLEGFDYQAGLAIQLAGAWGIALGLLAMYFLLPKTSVVDSKVFAAISALPPALYGVLLTAPSSTAWGALPFMLGMFLAGASSSLVLLGIGSGFSLYPRRYGITATCLASSLGAFLSVFINSASHQVAAMGTAALIPLSVVLFRRAGLIPEPVAAGNRKATFAAMRGYGSLFFFMFLYSTLFGLMVVAGSVLKPEGSDGSPLLAAICVPGLVVLALLSGTKARVDVESLRRALLALAVAGLIPLAIGASSSSMYFLLFLVVAFGVFDIANFVSLYEIIRENGISNQMAFAIGRAPSELGIATGWSIGLAQTLLFEDPLRPIVIMGVIVIVVIVVGLALFSKSDEGSSVSSASSSAERYDAVQISPYASFSKTAGEICEEFGLSPREREVFEMLAVGRTPKRISEKLFISESTAKSHCYRIYQKMGVHSQQDLLDIFEARMRDAIASQWKPIP